MFGTLKTVCENTQKTMNNDLDNMEKTIKAMRKSRRRFKAKRIMQLQKEELDLEDIMSSSEDSILKENLNTNNENIPNSPILDQNQNTISPVKNSDENTNPLQTQESCNLPRMALGGVPILENGEPLGATHSEEWVSEYGGTSSIVFLYKLKITRKVQNF